MSYFTDLYQEEKILRKHGFDYWPDERELAEYLFDTNDRMDVICAALGFCTYQDVRGRWCIDAAAEQVV